MPEDSEEESDTPKRKGPFRKKAKPPEAEVQAKAPELSPEHAERADAAWEAGAPAAPGISDAPALQSKSIAAKALAQGTWQGKGDPYIYSVSGDTVTVLNTGAPGEGWKTIRQGSESYDRIFSYLLDKRPGREYNKISHEPQSYVSEPVAPVEAPVEEVAPVAEAVAPVDVPEVVTPPEPAARLTPPMGHLRGGGEPTPGIPVDYPISLQQAREEAEAGSMLEAQPTTGVNMEQIFADVREKAVKKAMQEREAIDQQLRAEVAADPYR